MGATHDSSISDDLLARGWTWFLVSALKEGLGFERTSLQQVVLVFLEVLVMYAR